MPPPPAGHHAGPHCANDERGDDFIGRAPVELTMQELEAALPNVGDEHVRTIVLSPCPAGVSVCGGWDLPDYSFTFRVTRLPDVRVGVGSVLNEAMRRIGSDSELDTIVAGLRSLPALSPRKIEEASATLPVNDF